MRREPATVWAVAPLMLSAALAAYLMSVLAATLVALLHRCPRRRADARRVLDQLLDVLPRARPATFVRLWGARSRRVPSTCAVRPTRGCGMIVSCVAAAALSDLRSACRLA